MDDDLKELIKMAYAHSVSDADYYAGRYVATLSIKRTMLLKDIERSAKEDRPSLVRSYENRLDRVERELNQFKTMISFLRNGGK